jgi:hypothetical protein
MEPFFLVSGREFCPQDRTRKQDEVCRAEQQSSEQRNEEDANETYFVHVGQHSLQTLSRAGSVLN